MAKNNPTRERSGKKEENVLPSLSKSEATVAMNRFKNLARDVLNVSRIEVEKEEQNFKAENASKRKRGKRNAS